MEIYGITKIAVNILVCLFALLLVVAVLLLISILVNEIVYRIKEAIMIGKQKI